MRRAWALLWLVLGAWGPALAQQAVIGPTAAERCMTPAADARGPEYPAQAFVLRERGRVKVRLHFTGPAVAPDVDVLEREGDTDFVRAVKDRVSAFRLPCHGGGSTPVALDFDFIFRPDDRQVLWSRPVDADNQRRSRLLKCVVHVKGDQLPSFPMRAARAAVTGRSVMRLTYTAPDQPPQVESFPTPSSSANPQVVRITRELDELAADWASGYRMPCFEGAPVSNLFTVVFRMGETAGGFKPGLTLMDVLPLVQGIRQQTLLLDTNTMSCPFDLNWFYLQPSLPNEVGEVGQSDPSRRPLLDWLAQSQLEAPAAALASFYGDTALIHVPCLRINLKPQE